MKNNAMTSITWLDARVFVVDDCFAVISEPSLTPSDVCDLRPTEAVCLSLKMISSHFTCTKGLESIC